uniref:Uncharacterized protein n=1 Tax=Oryza punctata TaxID=4537 RepID=A0A0E0KTG1_ORYPU
MLPARATGNASYDKAVVVATSDVPLFCGCCSMTSGIRGEAGDGGRRFANLMVWHCIIPSNQAVSNRVAAGDLLILFDLVEYTVHESTI